VLSMAAPRAINHNPVNRAFAARIHARVLWITLDPQTFRWDGIARAVSSDVRCGHPDLRSL